MQGPCIISAYPRVNRYIKLSGNLLKNQKTCYNLGEERVTIGTKDIASKELISINRIFADIINGYIYKGEQKVRPEALSDYRTHVAYRSDRGVLHDQDRDVSKLLSGEVGLQMSLINMENQTGIEDKMPMRIIGYDGASYRQQLTKEWGEKESIPVITFVLYFGTEKEWKEKLALSDMFHVPKEYCPFFKDYDINVINVAWLPDEVIERFQSDFKILAKCLKHRRLHPDEPFMDEQKMEYARELLQMLTEVTGDRDFVENYVDDNGKEAKTMAEVFTGKRQCEIRAQKEGIQQGLKQGLEQGLEQGVSQERLRLITKLINKGMPEEFILSMEFTPEEITKAKEQMQNQ